MFREIFERVAGPAGGESGPMAGLLAAGRERGAWLRDWRLVAIDGFEADLPDSEANVAEFGYAGTGEGCSALPKARVVTLTECGTHAVLAAEIGTYALSEKALAGRLYPRLHADELLTADRNFYSYPAWETAAVTGAALPWRAPTNLILPVVRVLPDCTYLTMLSNPRTHQRHRRERVVAAAQAGHTIHPIDGQWARVIEPSPVTWGVAVDRPGRVHSALRVASTCRFACRRAPGPVSTS